MTFEPCICCGDRFSRMQEEAPGTVRALVCSECLQAEAQYGHAGLEARHGAQAAELARLGAALTDTEKR